MSSVTAAAAAGGCRITPQLLDVLLCPSTPKARIDGENYYHSLSARERLEGLLSFLLQYSTEDNNGNDDTNGGRRMLAATLLRRQISNMGTGSSSPSSNDEKKKTDKNDVDLQSAFCMLNPLLDLFFLASGTTTTTRNMIGHCIAELCLVLSVRCNVIYSENDGNEGAGGRGEDDPRASIAMRETLSRIHQCLSSTTSPSVDGAARNKLSSIMKLLGNLAQNAPVLFYSAIAPTSDDGAAAVLSSIPAAIQFVLCGGNGSVGAINKGTGALENCTECICGIAIAISSVESACHKKGGASEAGLSLQRAVEDLTSSSSSSSSGSSSSLASPRLGWVGEHLLLPLIMHVDTVILSSAASASSTSSSEEELRNVLQHVTDCVPRCSNLFGVPQMYRGFSSILLKTLSFVASCSERNMTLSVIALEGLYCLCQHVPIILSDHQVMAEFLSSGQHCHGILPHSCELLVQLVNDDVDEWSSESPPLILTEEECCVGDGGDDENLPTIENLLEGFVTVLGSENTLPVLLPIVQSLLASTDPQEWKKIRAGLSILRICHYATYAEAEVDSFGKFFNDAISAGVAFASHKNFRVRYQALELLGSLVSVVNNDDEDDDDGKEEDERENTIILRSNEILQALCGNMSADMPHKVSCHACLSLISFCRRGGNGNRTRGDIVRPHLLTILHALQSGPLSGLIQLQQQQAQNGGGTLMCSGGNNGSAVTVLRGIHALACLADCTLEAFRSHYPVSRALLSYAMKLPSVAAVGNENRIYREEMMSLRGGALEAFTIICGAVISPTGGEDDSAFRSTVESDACSVMTSFVLPMIASSETSTVDNCEVSKEQLITSSARLASGVLRGEKFAPFAPSVLPHLLGMATQEANVSIKDGGDDEDEVVASSSESSSVTFSLPGIVSGGPKRLTLNTSQIQEKVQSARAIYEIASSMKSYFGPHAEASAAAFLPLVGFPYYSEVRSTSAQALSAIFSSACSYASASAASSVASARDLYVRMFGPIAKSIVSQLVVEDNMKNSAAAEGEDGDAVDDIINTMAESMSDVFFAASKQQQQQENASVALFSPADADALISQIMIVVSRCLQRRKEILEVLQSSDDSLDMAGTAEMESELRKEGDLLTFLVDTVGYTMKCFSKTERDEGAFLSIFDARVAPIFQPLLSLPQDTASGADLRASIGAVCVFDDCVEHCGSQAAMKHSPALLQCTIQSLLRYGNDDNEDWNDYMAVSIYGIIQVVRRAPPSVVSPHVGTVISCLRTIVDSDLSSGHDHNEERSGLVENAMSALASMLLYPHAPFAPAVDKTERDSILQAFLICLPLRQVESEAKICHDGLCEMIESSIIDVKVHAEQLLRILADVLRLVGAKTNGGGGKDDEDIASPTTCTRIVSILKTIIHQQQECMDIQKALAMLSPENQKIIQAVV